MYRRKGWGARLSFQTDKGRIQRIVDLHTTSRSLAEAKLAKLLSGALNVAELLGDLKEIARRRETFGDAAKRLITAQGDEGMKTWTERLYRVEEFAGPVIGKLDPNEIKTSHIQEVFRGMVRRELSQRTIKHMKADLSRVFGDLIREELCSNNPVTNSVIPANAAIDTRERIVLTDEEFSAFMCCPEVPAELHVMALASRTLGGMRTSDLHAWDWSHINTDTWVDAHVPRPKVANRGRRQPRLNLPAMLVPVLQSHWDSQGRPRAGAVFPAARGPRAGRHKKRMSYAKELRAALWAAGVVRPLPGFHEAKSEEARKALCLIQSGDSLEYKPVDFHSFRRAFATSLAAAGVATPLAMALADHRDASTHARYVKLGQSSSLTIPEHALPQGLSTSLLNQSGSAEENRDSDGAPGKIRTSDFRFRRALDEHKTGDLACFTVPSEQGERRDIQEPAQSIPLNDPVTDLLADALRRAAVAGAWDTVAELTRELQARRQASANVVSLAEIRAKKGGA